MAHGRRDGRGSEVLILVVALEIDGYRGFASRRHISFAQPDGRSGSGLTLIVGPNNAGKSTIVEALRFFSSSNVPSFTEGKCNKKAGDRVSFRLKYRDCRSCELSTVSAGGSEAWFALGGQVACSRSPYLFTTPIQRLVVGTGLTVCADSFDAREVEKPEDLWRYLAGSRAPSRWACRSGPRLTGS